MKVFQKLTNERFARPAAKFMQLACYFAIGFFILCTALSFMGRQTFFLHTKTGTFERAIYAEENHDPPSRGMTIDTGDDIHVWTDDNDQIDPAIPIGLSLMFSIHILPAILSAWFLGRLFANVEQGHIFIEQNASFLLYSGLLQFAAAVIVPLIKLLIGGLLNLIPGVRISIATGQAMFTLLFPSIGFTVVAYILHYGVHLQDEVDHTL